MEQINNWMLKVYVAMSCGLSREEGQDFTEYAMILAVVVVLAVAGYQFLGSAITSTVNNVASQLTGAL